MDIPKAHDHSLPADFTQLKELNVCQWKQLVVTLLLYVNTIYG